MAKEEPERAPTVAFLGPDASYTHQAALQYAPSAQLQSQRTIKDVFATVQNGTADTGIVPFENSSNGPVDMTLDCLTDRDNDFPGLRVTGEVYVPVTHCLLGMHASQSKEPVDKISDVYSHPQALGQCASFLATRLQHADQHEVSSTSEAAATVARLDSPYSAAISSRLAATVYKLDILAEAVQDQKDNGTRFLVVSRSTPPSISSTTLRPKDRQWKSLLRFTIQHELPGSLASALLVFKQHELNLTSMNSRPSRRRPWHYIFLVEFECRVGEEEMEKRVEGAVGRMGEVAESCEFLGTWRE